MDNLISQNLPNLLNVKRSIVTHVGIHVNVDGGGCGGVIPDGDGAEEMEQGRQVEVLVQRGCYFRARGKVTDERAARLAVLL